MRMAGDTTSNRRMLGEDMQIGERETEALRWF